MDIEKILQTGYRRVFIWDDASKVFVASVDEFQGCVTQGKTLEEANERLSECAALWVECESEAGRDIPPPKEDWILDQETEETWKEYHKLEHAYDKKFKTP